MSNHSPSRSGRLENVAAEGMDACRDSAFSRDPEPLHFGGFRNSV
ncbi:MAG TPA: hypothetical protein VM925_19610 [Labilithrix sp.]|nr:hypothetical protein [Labilithrix sp.]